MSPFELLRLLFGTVTLPWYSAAIEAIVESTLYLIYFHSLCVLVWFLIFTLNRICVRLLLLFRKLSN